MSGASDVGEGAEGGEDGEGEIVELVAHREGDDGLEFQVRFAGKTEPDDEHYSRDEVEEAAAPLLRQYERREGFVDGAPAVLEDGDIDRLVERRGDEEASWEYKVHVQGDAADELDWFGREEVVEALGEARAGTMLAAFDESVSTATAKEEVGEDAEDALHIRKITGYRVSKDNPECVVSTVCPALLA